MERRALLAAVAAMATGVISSRSHAQDATASLPYRFAAVLSAHNMTAFAALFAEDYVNHQSSAAAPPPAGGKSQKQVQQLIAGPGVYICDNCINVCKGILDKELNEDARRQTTSLRVPKPAEIRRQLDQYVVGQESAKKVLTKRVRNSPPARNESRWLPGWLNRINTYVQS